MPYYSPGEWAPRRHFRARRCSCVDDAVELFFLQVQGLRAGGQLTGRRLVRSATPTRTASLSVHRPRLLVERAN